MIQGVAERENINNTIDVEGQRAIAEVLEELDVGGGFIK